MDVRFLILTLFFLASCMPAPTVSKGDLSSSNTTSGTSSGSDGTSTTTSLTWNYLGQLTKTITINVSNLNNAYIVGTPVESYYDLNSSNFTGANYCLVSTYSIGGVVHELRTRIVPISYYDFTKKRTVRNMRVDFSDVTNSTTYCNNMTRVKNSTGTYIADPTTPTSSLYIHYNPAQICTTCTSILTATRARVFKLETTGYLDEVPSNYINSSLLTLQVDPNYNTTGSSGSCTNAECKSRGYNCCLENQCVNDGAVRPSASTLYSSLLATAEQERLQNPLAYLNYPQLYYICGTSVPSTTGGSTSGSTTSGSSGGSYDPGFVQLKKDFYCIQNLKSQATTTPFHNEILTKSYTASIDCLTAAADSSQTFYYQNVMKRLYTTCGCNRTDLAEMIANCPAYDYTVTSTDTTGAPVRIDCYTPNTSTPTVPLNQSVSVSGRSAPHRFFDVNGTERAPSDGVDQEGDAFEYLDEGKVLPNQQTFSMNAILGQMSVALDKALPAKSVNVELDQIYLISTTSGYYSPCPTCGKDSWLNAFTAFPSSSMGAGLQAVGFTTERDSFGTNTTAGNYEDTIFGRACWLPPTMIPYSHSSKGTVKDQRANRLQTQAALFANGYQRDWFGFNKGALIGSFDGVSWFAVGKGRIVRSTSKKLYLAINAPFADLATPTMHVVRVAAYDGITQAAQVDYDPQYHQSHPYQNEAGNCQKYHMCSTDTDCITKLGWEYACADVRDLKSNWPEFDIDAKEKANVTGSLTIDQILQQKKFPSASTKRCVYRGAGAVCHSNAGNLSSTDLNKKKLLTCAPNFYCANAGTAGLHNTKIARYASTLDQIPVARNHFFGKDANVLGRPLDYLASGSLPSAVRTTLADNLAVYESTMSSAVGLCQPGKALPTTSNQVAMSNPFNQHASVDATRRADYISQIGSCNSTLFTTYRHSSCPVLGSDGNYEMFASGTIASGYEKRASNQNACGLESLLNTASLSSPADSLQSYSPFRSIEAKTLSSQIIVDPTLARDACFRRAGSACHTDLDCSPNKMHASQVDYFTTAFFGNSAEKNYWSEYLVCGQTDPKPLPSDTEAFKNYDMGLNRCCREVGKDLTTYTSDIATDTFVNAAKPYDPASAGLKMSLTPGTAPNDPKRYSRLASVDDLGTSTKPILSANIDRVGNALTSAPNITSPHQWKTLTEANSEGCCGGGWIRKFSDGTNDWTRRNRLVLDVTNFVCLNARTPLITHPLDISTEYSGGADVQSLIGRDYGDYCKDATNTNGACAQYSMNSSTSDIYPAVDNYDNTVQINTVTPVYSPSTGNGDYYFKPRSADGDAAVAIDYNSTTTGARRNIAITVPSYVTRDFDTKYAATPEGGSDATYPIDMVTSDASASIGCTKNETTFNPLLPTDYFASGLQECRYRYDSSSRKLVVAASSSAFGAGGVFEKKKVGIRFTVRAPGFDSGIVRKSPGSAVYYLKRLGRLELSGIPQVAFEMLTCSNNSNRLVPGIFKTGVDTVAAFTNAAISFNPSAGSGYPAGQYFTNMQGLQTEPVFSSNDYKCCAPLGKTVKDAGTCCSGYAISSSSSSTKKTCALPAGTDLMVYFNRFVSNEGRGTEQPGGGLVEADFDSQTGEPLILSSVNDKIRALGKAYCATGDVRQGGAFGLFPIEPAGSDTKTSDTLYNIVDSSRDIGQVSNAGTTIETGYNVFTDGFRWNHHLYCNE